MDEPGPSQITPSNSEPKKTVGSRVSGIIRTFTTKQGLIGDYDYKFLFTPRLPFSKKAARGPPFFGLNDEMPVVLALILGFQHALAMLAGIITPPIILSGEAGANLEPDTQQYLVSAALITSGLLSLIQITRFHIYKTP
jgi:uric acid-xanthine permease